MGPTWPQAEGLVLGLAVKMFTIAGPVLVYGTAASVVYGVVYWICSLFWEKAPSDEGADTAKVVAGGENLSLRQNFVLPPPSSEGGFIKRLDQSVKLFYLRDYFNFYVWMIPANIVKNF